LELLKVADPKSVFLGTLVANTPLVATVLFILSGAWLGMAIVSDRDPELVAILAGPLLIISVLIMPAPVFGSVAQDAFSSAFLAFGVGYVFTPLLPIIAKWLYDTPEFVILTKGFEVYAPGSLMSLKQLAKPLQARLGVEGAAAKAEQDTPGAVFSQLVSRYKATVTELAVDAKGSSSVLAGMRGDKADALTAQAGELSDQRLKVVIPAVDHFIKDLDFDREQALIELQNKKVPNSETYVQKLEELRKEAEQARLELASRRPVVQKAQSLKVMQVSRLITALAFFAVALFTIANSEMWLPASQITLRSSLGEDGFVGYVLADSGGWTTIMRDANRSIVRVPTSSVASEPICSPRESVFDDSVYEVFFVGVTTAKKASPSC